MTEQKVLGILSYFVLLIFRVARLTHLTLVFFSLFFCLTTGTGHTSTSTVICSIAYVRGKNDVRKYDARPESFSQTTNLQVDSSILTSYPSTVSILYFCGSVFTHSKEKTKEASKVAMQDTKSASDALQAATDLATVREPLSDALPFFNYGTAGFRFKANLMDGLMVRVGIVGALLLMKQEAAFGSVGSH